MTTLEHIGSRPDNLSLANWLDPPYNQWAFSHVRELVPTQRIARGLEPPSDLIANPVDVSSVVLSRTSGSKATVADVVEDTFTDALVIIHRGNVVVENYFGETKLDTPHTVMSISKSLLSCVAACLVDRGELSPSALVTEYVPELTVSGYAGSRVSHLLDMRSGVRFSEDTDDPNSEVWGLLRAMGWSPSPTGAGANSMYDFLTTLVSERPHGGKFSYRDSDADVLGWVCERASGRRMADLIASELWAHIGAEYDAEITCDAFGAAGHDGGVCATARDLARFGQLLLGGGYIGGKAVVPPGWLRTAWSPPADTVEACRASESAFGLEGAWYRHLLWFAPRGGQVVLLCRGAFGQLIYVNPSTATVAVKFSSWPVTAMSVESKAVEMTEDTLRAFDAIGAALGAPSAANGGGTA